MRLENNNENFDGCYNKCTTWLEIELPQVKLTLDIRQCEQYKQE